MEASKPLTELDQRPLPFAVVAYVKIGEYHPWLGAIEGKLSLLPEHLLKQSLAVVRKNSILWFLTKCHIVTLRRFPAESWAK
jgi:hypothetical protein